MLTSRTNSHGGTGCRTLTGVPFSRHGSATLQNVTPTNRSAWLFVLVTGMYAEEKAGVGHLVYRISGESRRCRSFSVTPPPTLTPAVFGLVGGGTDEELVETCRYTIPPSINGGIGPSFISYLAKRGTCQSLTDESRLSNK